MSNNTAKNFKLRDFIKVIDHENGPTYCIALFDIGFGFVGLMPYDSPALEGYLNHIVVGISPGCDTDVITLERGFYVKVMEDMT